VDLEENKALVRRYYQEVLTGRDRDLLARLLDSSFVSHVSGGPAAGAVAYTAAVAATHAAFPDLVVTVHDQVAEEDKVVTGGALRQGRHRRHPRPDRHGRAPDSRPAARRQPRVGVLRRAGVPHLAAVARAGCLFMQSTCHYRTGTEASGILRTHA
jgi:SnoaL-like polyketide cyclase